MYKLRNTQDDPQRFTNTAIGVKGELVFTNQFTPMGDCYELTGTRFIDGESQAFYAEVRDEDIDWLPNIGPGYFNYMGRPWAGLWVEQTAARQYHVGLNERNIRAYTSWQQRAKSLRDKGVSYHALAAIYEGRDAYHPLERALSMIRRRKDANTQCALSRNLAIERGPLGIVYLVFRAQRLVGLVQDGQLLVETSFTHRDLATLEYRHETIEELRGILQSTKTPPRTSVKARRL